MADRGEGCPARALWPAGTGTAHFVVNVSLSAFKMLCLVVISGVYVRMCAGTHM